MGRRRRRRQPQGAGRAGARLLAAVTAAAVLATTVVVLQAAGPPPVVADEALSDWGQEWSVTGPTDTYTVCGDLGNGTINDFGNCTGGTWAGKVWPSPEIVRPGETFTLAATDLAEYGEGYGAWMDWNAVFSSSNAITPVEDCTHGPDGPDPGYARDAIKMSCTYRVNHWFSPPLPGAGRETKWAHYGRNLSHIFGGVAPVGWPFFVFPEAGNIHGLIRDADGEVIVATRVWNGVRRRQAGPVTLRAPMDAATAARKMGYEGINCPESNRILDAALPGVFNTSGVCPSGMLPGDTVVTVPAIEFSGGTISPSSGADGVTVDQKGGFAVPGLSPGTWQIEFDAYTADNQITRVRTPWVEVAPDNNLSYAREGEGEVVAQMSVTPVAGTPGRYQLVAESTSSASGPLSHTWFVDGAEFGTGPAVTVTFTTPGPHGVRLVSRDSSNRTDDVTQTIQVPAPSLGVDISFPGLSPAQVALDQSFDVDVTVSAGSGGVGSLDGLAFTPGSGGVATTPPVLRWAGSTGLELVAGPNPVPATGTALHGGDSVTYRVRLKGTSAGTHTLSSSVQATDGALRTVTDEATRTIVVEGPRLLEATLTFDQPEVILAQDEAGASQPVDLTATLQVKNVSDADLENVHLADDDFDIFWDRTGTLPPVTFGVEQTAGPTPSGTVGTLAAGATAPPITYTVRASDDGDYRFQLLVLAAGPGGGTISERVVATVKIREGVVLTFDLEEAEEDAGQPVVSGRSRQVFGELVNLSNTEKLDVAVPTKVEGNATGGQIVPLGDPYSDCRIEPTFTLAPGERLPIKALVRTAEDGGTRGDITWTTVVVATDTDGTTRDLTPEEILAAERSLRLTVDDAYKPHGSPITTIDLMMWTTVGFGKGIVDWVKGWGDLIPLIQALVSVNPFVDPLALPRMLLKANSTAEWMVTAWASLTEDERQAFLAEVQEKITNAVPDAWEKLNTEVAQKLTAVANGWYLNDDDGSVRDAVIGLSAAAGNAVFDFALCELAAPRMLSRLGPAVARHHDEMESIANAAAATRDLTRVKQLRAGTRLVPDTLARLFGLDRANAYYLQQAAERFGVTIAVKGRNEVTLDLFRRFGNRVRLKPEFYKPKMVNQIDHIALGYNPQHQGLAVFKKPMFHPADPPFPAGTPEFKAWKQGEGKRLLDEVSSDTGPLRAHFDELVAQGKLTPEEWQTVRSRWRGRAEEWWDYEDLFKREFTNNGMPMGFNAKDNGIDVEIETPDFSSPKNRAKFALEPIGEEAYLVNIADHPGPGGVLKRVAGDIDVIAILEADMSPIVDKVKRAKVYQFLAETIGMQHPETGTWLNYEKAVQILMDHTQGGDPLAAFSPGRSPVASLIDRATLAATPSGSVPQIFLKGVLRDAEKPAVDLAGTIVPPPLPPGLASDAFHLYVVGLVTARHAPSGDGDRARAARAVDGDYGLPPLELPVGEGVTC